ncbi:SPOR domain-containing protein [Thermodesulfobacteriota bacterium]
MALTPIKTLPRFLFLRLITASLFIIPPFLPSAYAEKGFYSIQIGAYRNLDSAKARVDELIGLGHNSFYREEKRPEKQKIYRVFIEKFASKNEAEKEALTLKRLNLISDYTVKFVGTGVGKTSSVHLKKSAVYYLHVSSFQARENAEKKVQVLKEKEHKAFLVKEKVGETSWFRVYIGEFSDEGQARKVGAELKRGGVISYFKPIMIDRKVLLPESSSE